MKIFSYNRKPKIGAAQIGTYERLFGLIGKCAFTAFFTAALSPITVSPITVSPITVSLITVLASLGANTLAITNAYGDRLLNNTEALRQKQALVDGMFAKKSQDVDIVGLFDIEAEKDWFLSVASSGKVSAWQLKSGKERQILPAGEPISACAYQSQKNWLAVSQDRGVSVFDLKTKARLVMSPSFGTKSASLDFSPDGNSILVGGEDGKVYRWKLNALEEEDPTKKIVIERYLGHSAAVTAVAYHPFNRMFFSADSFGTVAAWLSYDKDLFSGKYDERANQTTYYTEDGPRATSVSPDSTTILSLKISKDGQQLFAALQDGRIQWMLVRGLKVVIVAHANKGAIYDMQLSPSGRLLASVARDGIVRVWKPIALEQAGQVPGGKKQVSEINDFKKDSIGYFSLVKEIALQDARKLLFLSETSLVVGENSGRLLEINL